MESKNIWRNALIEVANLAGWDSLIDILLFFSIVVFQVIHWI